MYLKSIELSGFKSFAKKSSLEFNTRITSIVGPNGSGKSNVAEAFRFVLGEQSIKSLRGRKGEDLIFNGAGGEAKANRASVKVVFDNSKNQFGIDFPEVSIERVVHRDGINEYLVNGSVVRLKDVVELLAKAHIGASGHHIISQGEADRILNASEKERKSIIEDALGLKIYQYKRLESDRKLKKTFENIAQVESLRKEIAPHLRFLKKQAEKIEKAENLREELLALSKEYFKKEETYLSSEKRSLAEERKPVDAALEKLSKESKDAKRVLEYESGLNEVRDKKDSINRELGKLDGLIFAETQVIENERKLSASNDTKTVRLAEVERLYEEISVLEDLKEALRRISDFIGSLKHSTDSGIITRAEERIAGYKKDRARLEAELSKAAEKEKEISEAERAVFRIMSEEQTLIGRLNTIKMREERLKLEEDEFKRDLAEIGALAGPEVLEYRKAEFGAESDRKLQEERKHHLERLKIRLEESGISGAGDVLKEWKEVTERDEFLARELLDLEKSAESLRQLIKDLETRLATEFSEGVKKINSEFGRLFSAMFGGGDAHLTLIKIRKRKTEESDSPLLEDESETEEETEEGLEISVNLPRKKIRGLMMLSGGERALTSIALLFAISAVNPPPFIILDETDAALDEANSKKYGDMVEALSKRSQLILITHNRETMSRAGVIYGVTMGSTGVSKLLSIAFEEALEVAK